jgi:hypothetical protein
MEKSSSPIYGNTSTQNSSQSQDSKSQPQNPKTQFHPPETKSQTPIFRISKLTAIAKQGLLEKISTFLHQTPKTQFSTAQIEEHLRIVMSIPTQIYFNEKMGLYMSLKFLYPHRDEQLPDFVALRIVGFVVEVSAQDVEFSGFNLGEGYVKEVGNGRERIMDFKADGFDDAPTLGLDMEVDLSSLFTNLRMLRMPKMSVPFSIIGKEVKYFLQVRAMVEYFGRTFKAEWIDVPVSVFEARKEEEDNDGDDGAPPHWGGYAALKLPQGRDETLPAYDDESVHLEDKIGKAV